MIQGILALIKEFLRFSSQMAENKGAKIPLTADEIRQRSKNKTARLSNKGEAASWIALIQFYNKQLEPRWQLHAKNQVRDLVKSGADIVSIEYSQRRSGNWLVITYARAELGYKREYFIKAK